MQPRHQTQNSLTVHLLIVFGVLLGLSIGGVGVWGLTPPLSALVDPAARDLRVVTHGLGEWEIRYRTSAPAFHWYLTATNRLDATGWTTEQRWRPDHAIGVYQPLAPLQFRRLVGLMVWEDVVLDPDIDNPTQARIRVRRGIRIAHALDWLNNSL
jgi:hypothetical protein